MTEPQQECGRELELSPIDLPLFKDPSGEFGKCDLLTRETYAAAAQEIADWANQDVRQVARACLELAEASADACERWVGYFLLGPKRPDLERAVGARIPAAERFRRELRRHPDAWYGVTVAAVSVGLLGGLVLPAVAKTGYAALALGFALLPVVHLGCAIAQFLMAAQSPPKRAARVNRELTGQTPPDTAVIIPVIIKDLSEIEALLRVLRQNLNNNPPGRHFFCLLVDFADAETRCTKSDLELETALRTAVGRLNREYDHNSELHSSYLVRERRFNEHNNVWMGWERKRGKVHEFCQAVSGGLETSLRIPATEASRLSQIKYVVTLDSDSVLSPGAVDALVGVLKHPAQRLPLPGRTGGGGFAIATPRILISPQSSNTLFGRLQNGRPGPPPPREVAPSFYQDSFGEDLYYGKGALDVRRFLRSVDKQLPENLLLSHDHLEGMLAGVVLVSDAHLYETAPNDYLSWRRRRHRWIRGDVQAVAALLPSWAGFKVGARPALRAIHRWKLIDNLVGHLTPAAVLGTLVSAWLGAFHNPVLITSVALLALTPGVVLAPIAAAFGPSRNHVKARLENAVRGFQSALRAWAVAVVALPDAALSAVEAVLRSTYRMAVSRRRMLEWAASREARNGENTEPTAWNTWCHMAASPLLSVAIAIAVSLHASERLLWISPFLLLWFFSPQLASWSGRSDR